MSSSSTSLITSSSTLETFPVLKEYLNTRESLTDQYLQKIKTQNLSLRQVPERYRTPDILLAAISLNGAMIEYVFQDELTYEMCLIAVQNSNHSLGTIRRLFGESKITLELCKKAIEYDGKSLQHVPIYFKTESLCMMAVRNNGRAIKYVPENMRYTRPFLSAVFEHNDPEVVKLIPHKEIEKFIHNKSNSD